ncbi:short-chain fatty acids transporter [Caldalkalibacillus uzonensis]|uniref:Short-chain fatty acids transporter n=1 Tax=Caldalkalibacillus uzonensis TaxID=353224 RepID=A0ABU0CU32_9BACI|nr:TIGR00366 family protein [Caldalkalibacillus uzonensis]MDQ0339938.1 short-chain fatty acids transporter [Caldalkalibacillus uzonensis]
MKPEQQQPQTPRINGDDNPIAKLGGFFARIAEKWLPDAFVFAVLLTAVVFLGGIFINKKTPFEMMTYWGDGFWELITFTGQVITTFVMSYALAITPPVNRLLQKIAGICKTPGQAIVLVTFTALGASLISWAFGLVVGGIMAKMVGQKVKDVDYRVLVAAAYSGYVIWHGGLSSSSALFVATEGHAFQDIVGIIPTSETLLSTLNLFLIITISLTLPFVMKLLHPKRMEDRFIIDPKLLEDKVTDESTEEPGKFVNDRLDNSRAITTLAGLLGLIYLGYHFFIKGGSLDLNTVNLIFITFVLLCFSNVRALGKGMVQASGSVGQLALQYPFYAGIMGMMTASGLAAWLSELFVSISTAKTLPLFTFLAGGLVNMFIPSGGGQWAVQAPIFLPAALELGVEPWKIVLGVAWGDAWTNMIQPFWAVPLLAIAGLRIRDIMGFTTVTLLWTGLIMIIGFLIFG